MPHSIEDASLLTPMKNINDSHSLSHIEEDPDMLAEQCLMMSQASSDRNLLSMFNEHKILKIAPEGVFRSSMERKLTKKIKKRTLPRHQYFAHLKKEDKKKQISFIRKWIKIRKSRVMLKAKL